MDVLPALTYVNGISALVIVVIANVIGVSFVRRYIQERKALQPYVALMGFTIAWFHMGVVVSFLALVFTGQNIDPMLAGILAYFIVPVAIIDVMYLGFTLFSPDYTKRVLLIYGLTAVVFYVAFFGFPEAMIGGEIPYEGAVVDTSLNSLVLGLVIFYIFSVLLILGWGFYRLSLRIEGPEQKKAKTLAWGFLLFAIGAIIETAIPTVAIVVARVIMAVGYYFLYRGFSS